MYSMLQHYITVHLLRKHDTENEAEKKRQIDRVVALYLKVET